MEYSKTQKGAQMLGLGGYLYIIYSIKNVEVRWRCKYRDCKGFVVIKNETLPPRKQGDHTCGSNEGKNQALLAKKNILTRCKEENDAFISIYTDETKVLQTSILHEVTSYENLRDYARKIRNERDNYMPGPENDIPDEFKNTLNGKKFLQFDSGVKSISRVIIFFSDDFLTYINDLEIVVVDGTFRSSPQQFYQLVTIQGYIFGKFIPFIFILLQDKTEEKYKEVFLYLKDKNILNPKVVVTDYERALFSSFNVYGDHVMSYGCLFHYGQCLWRKMQQNGLESIYRSDVNARKILKQFLNLPYLKETKIRDAYDFILQNVNKYPEKEIFDEFIVYYERTFMGKAISSVPLFEHKRWSVFERIQRGFPTTTNSLEGWHRGFNNLVNIRNPNLGFFIDALRQETEKTRNKIARYVTGQFEIGNTISSRKEKLNIYANNEKYMSIEGIFSFLDALNTWSFDD